MSINFKATRKDYRTIQDIADRAVRLTDLDRLTLEMDITAVHLNGCPLDLIALLAFRDFDFLHDIYGIHNCIDRKTGKLQRCFSPRCSLPEQVGA